MTNKLESGQYRRVGYDKPWRRLPWTVTLAICIELLALWGMAFFLNNKPGKIERPQPIEARIFELPEPQQSPPAPPVASDSAPAPQLRRQQAKPQLARRPASINPDAVPSAAAELSQTANVLASNLQPNQVTTRGDLPKNPEYANPRGTHVRAKAAGVVGPVHGLSIQNEENPPDPDMPGQGLGGWVQEYPEPCDDLLRSMDEQLWQYKCGHIPVFTQPPNPWCYNAAPAVGIEGSCGWEFDRGMAAFRRKDYASAFAMFQKLAEKEYAPAQSNLAAMYAEGLGTSQNDERAAYWYKKAAAEGDAKAVYNLALIYSDGRGVAKDLQKAAYWYGKAAHFGFANAQYNLAVLYALGIGVAKDEKQAAYWYRKAADRGDATAQFNLAVMYTEGEGVPKDRKQAMYWYCKGAARGDEKARSGLASLYANGAVLPANDELAYFCWLVSSSRRVSYQNAQQGRDALEKVLLPEQRSNAQAAFLAWKAK